MCVFGKQGAGGCPALLLVLFMCVLAVPAFQQRAEGRVKTKEQLPVSERVRKRQREVLK